MEYVWPGDVRELKHLLERAAIQSNTSTFNLTRLAIGTRHKTEDDLRSLKPFSEVEGEHIVAALRGAHRKVT